MEYPDPGGGEHLRRVVVRGSLLQSEMKFGKQRINNKKDKEINIRRNEEFIIFLLTSSTLMGLMIVRGVFPL